MANEVKESEVVNIVVPSPNLPGVYWNFGNRMELMFGHAFAFPCREDGTPYKLAPLGNIYDPEHG